MRNELNFWVVGGDMRQAKLAELLAGDGHTVHTFGLERLGPLPEVEAETRMEGIALADCVVLPLPAAGAGSPRRPGSTLWPGSWTPCGRTR